MGADKKAYRKVAKDDLRSFVDELSEAQRLLWANGSHALLIVLQAMEAAGKDGTNPSARSCQGSIRRAARSSRSNSRPPPSSDTTSCGGPTSSSPSAE